MSLGEAIDIGGRKGIATVGWPSRAMAPSTAVRAIVPMLILLLWWWAARHAWMSPQILPAPLLVFETAGELAADNLFSNLGCSLVRLFGGLAAGILGGIALGTTMGLSRRAEQIVLPTFTALVQIPTLAWIPLLMVLLGLGEALKIVVIFKAVVTPITFNVHVGVRDVDPKLAEVARVLRLSFSERLRLLVLPSALPAFLTGLRLALSQAWTSLLAVELLASSEGIGFLMVWGRQLFQLDVVFVCIAVIGFVGLSMDVAAGRIDRAVMRWPRPALAQNATSQGGGLWALVLPIVIVAVWALASARGWVDAHVLPPPTSVIAALVQGFSDHSLDDGLVLSLRRAFSGLAIGGTAGFLVGLLLGSSRTAERLFGGTLTVLRLVAIFAWLPLLTAWAGLGEASKVTFVSLACFFPLQVATERGVAGLSVQLVEVARTLRLPVFVRLYRLVLPGAAPSIFAGLRLALVVSWIATMGAEYFMPSGGGLGSLMINAEQMFRTDVVMAAMVLVGLAAAAISALGQAVERRATRWRVA